MIKRCSPPSQGWLTFLRNHAPDIAAMDLFVAPTIGFDLLYAFIIVRLARRDLVWINVTTNPSADWIATMGIRDKPIAPGSPWQNSFAERLIGSIRRECVDHVIVLGEAHLRRILQAYARYYNDLRTHRSLDKGAPFSRPVQRPAASCHMVSSVDCITTTSESEFLVHKGD
jgi:Integrase core domain